METIKVRIELPIIDGFEYTGEYRGAKRGEHYLKYLILQTRSLDDDNDTLDSYPILKEKRWRAPENGEYRYIHQSYDGWYEIRGIVEDFGSVDDNRYKAGNYFKTAAQAEAAKGLLIKTLKDFHNE